MTKKNIIVTILIVTISNSSLFAWSEDQKMKYTVDKSNFESDKRDRERNQFRNEERARQQKNAAVQGKYFSDPTRSYNDSDGQTTETKALKEVAKHSQRNINQANSPHHPIKNSNSKYDSDAYGTDLYQSDGYQSGGY